MCIYKLSAQEIADLINDALEQAEGDFDIEELEKALRLVLEEQKLIAAS